MSGKNNRVTNGHRRKKLRAKVAALGLPCALCGQPIDYSLTTYKDPKDGKIKPHPLRYELDEIIPVKLGGNDLDEKNVQPVHRICNQHKGSKMIVKTASKPDRCSRDW